LNSNNSVDNKRPALLHNQNRTDEGNDRKRIRLDNNYSGSNQDTKPTPPDPTTISTHIVFVIDFSGSMRTKDVATKNGTKITRWDAVFECIDGFLEDQINSGRDEENAIVIDGDENYNYKGSAATTTVSVVIFNDKGQALLRHVPLVGDGRKVRSQLESARKNHSPRGGTGFSAGFQLAKQLGTQDASGRALTPKKTKRQNTVVVFLSDGRPGDLSHHPPKKASLPMQTTFRRKKKTHVAAGEHIQQMKRTLGDRFALHFICIHKDGKSVSVILPLSLA
jgi:Mg-chelatase subunit ChlD